MISLLFPVSLSVSSAFAQDSLPVPDAAPDAVSAAELEALRAALAQAQAQDERLSALLEAAGVIAALDASPEARVAAVGTLARSLDVRVLPFLERAAQQDPEVRLAVLAYAMSFSAEPRMHALVRSLLDPRQPVSVQVAAAMALDVALVPDAFELLWQIVTDGERSEEVREVARSQLQVNHAEQVAQRGGLPSVTRHVSPGAVAGIALPSAAVGSLVLASVGQLGQTSTGTAIGGVGGAIIGGGLGAVAARAGSVSPEDSLQYASGTAWGMTAAAMLAAGADVQSEGTLYLLALGSAAGAGGALLSFSQEPSLEDTWELNGAILLGQQLASGAARWTLEDDTRVPLAGLVGGAIGGLSGAALRGGVSLDGDDGALMTAGGSAGLWLSLLVPPALEAEVDGGAVQLAVPLGVIAGGVAGQVLDVPAQQTGIATYGFVSGNLAGVGSAVLLRPEDATSGASLARWTLLGGAAGAAVGAAAAPAMTFDAGDAALIPVGTLLTIGEVSAVSYVLSEKIGFDRPGGLILLGAGLGSAGWGGLSQVIDTSPGASLLVASAAGWGVFYGGLTPYALGLEGEPADLVLSMTLTGTALMGGAMVAQAPAVGLEPAATVLPQLGGVGGAVVGSLGMALFTDSGQAISAGALGGSLAGIGAGVLLERRVGDKWIPRLEIPHRPHLPLPGVWRLAASPTVLEDDALGVYLGVQGAGF